jgi:hypothetical protein
MRPSRKILSYWRHLVFAASLVSSVEQFPAENRDHQALPLQVRQQSDVSKVLNGTTSASISSSESLQTQLSTLDFSSNFTIAPITYTPTSPPDLCAPLINSPLLAYSGNNNTDSPRGANSSHNANLRSSSYGQRNIPDHCQRSRSNSFHLVSDNLHTHMYGPVLIQYLTEFRRFSSRGHHDKYDECEGCRGSYNVAYCVVRTGLAN